MYRLQILYCDSWRIGINDYDSLETAEARVKRLAEFGIKARVKSVKELFGNGGLCL